MYSKIVVPVDLTHTEKLDKALTTAGDLAKHYNAEVFLLGVANSTPGEIAHNPKEFAEKLADFAASQSAAQGIEFRTIATISTDIAVDLVKTLDTEIHRLGADLVVMASHVPGFRDYIFRSNSGYLASHMDISVLVVR
ncbi:MAG: universal stress protein [Granulosicoccus sp.]